MARDVATPSELYNTFNLLQRQHDNRIVSLCGEVREAVLGALVAKPVLHAAALRLVFRAAVQRLDVVGKDNSHTTAHLLRNKRSLGRAEVGEQALDEAVHAHVELLFRPLVHCETDALDVMTTEAIGMSSATAAAPSSSFATACAAPSKAAACDAKSVTLAAALPAPSTEPS